MAAPSWTKSEPEIVGTDIEGGIISIRADLGEGDATKHFSVKKRSFSEKPRGVGNSVNQGLGMDLYRQGNSVKTFGSFAEPPGSEN